MFHLVTVALASGALTGGLAWRTLGAGALLLAPAVASFTTLACAVALDRRRTRARSAETWVRGFEAGAPGAAANDRPLDPAALCRRRA